MTIDCTIVFDENKHFGFYVTGQTVNGVIDFEIKSAKTFKKIVLLLTGSGKLRQTSRISNTRTHETKTRYFTEKFEKEKVTLLFSPDGKTYPPGKHSIPFSFVIPKDIPPSFAFLGLHKLLSRVKCRIKHKISVVFHQIRKLIDTTKTFKQEIYIVSGVKPRLSPVPVIYGERKEIIQLFNFKKKLIRLKVNMEKSILLPGDKVRLSYEVTNDSNINIITTRVRLFEVYYFHIQLGQKPMSTIYRRTSSFVKRSPRILRRTEFKETLELDIPKTASSVDFTTLVRRDYLVCFVIVLPCCRQNLSLNIPVLVNASQDESIRNKDNDLFLSDFLKPIKKYDEKRSYRFFRL